MKKHIVIIGGGFAGINLANSLSKNKNFKITLVDKNNYHFFPPLIYQVATGFLEPSSISYPFRKLLKENKNIRFWLGEFVEVISSENKLKLNNGELSYDYLVFATGTQSNFFGMENVKKHAIPMKTLDDALNMRNILLQRIEKATITKNKAEKKRLLTMVVVGGGPTGVEVSGMFAEMSKTIIRKEYPELNDVRKTQIYLIDGGNSLLSPMSEKSQKYTLESLKKLGVQIKLNTHVVDYDGEVVTFKDGSYIKTKNLIWAAGVSAITFDGIPATSYGRAKRLIVDEFNKIKDTENIYAIGDTCIMENVDEKFMQGHPQVAQVAIQQGKNLAQNFKNISLNKPLQSFKYKDKGSMAIIGRAKAVADIPGNTHFNGFFAWIMWLFVHIMSLVNYRNRLQTLYNWAIAYFTKDQSLRIIIRPKEKI
ncbi:NAD(P)/FAD-dependent oxidoreductase [Flavobacterium sp. HXWNR69]|uniref:NADH:ubiquinone reductase (non-electrogenic) n=1 Tax=Flavobacterium fragile TaxID=2949085 RepID=A0ABT0TD17_9FLAO|nr:NAD(P)/FAD-dependent oxidoreductase [Flavobacterium sp. HXWNR69]MCL9768854.1 NAD(P)/FAD-dependent oxidoreductase [Flavobacterium sp. HXWNR69]